MGSSQITNILNIRNEAPERIRIVCASTPSGKREEYYEWCTNASKQYHCKQEDIDNLRFTGYNVTEKPKREGNGWVEIWAPSIVNRELLKINPDTEQTYLEDLRESLTETRYNQEVLALFGDEEGGVYKKELVELAISEGTRVGHRYLNINDITAIKEFNKRKKGPLILATDWDKVQAGCNLLALYLDKTFVNEQGIVEPKFVVLFALEIPRSEFTYINAMNKIVELNDKFNFDWIAIDRGYGETQIEMLKQYGIANPTSGLVDKIVPIHFGEKIEVRDPHTLRADKKEIKPFMVNNSVLAFEKGKIVLSPQDKNLIEQIYAYRVERLSQKGLPVYSSDNEHSLDCMNMCLLVFERKYGALFNNILKSKVIKLGAFRKNDDVGSRDIINESSIKEMESLASQRIMVKKTTRNTGSRQKFRGRNRF